MSRAITYKTVDNIGIAVLVLAALAAPLFTANAYHLNVLVLIGVNSILAVGLAIVIRAGRLSLAQASFGGIGGYTTGILVIDYGFNYWLGLMLAGTIAAFFGVLLGFTSLRLRGFYFAIATFVFSQIAIVVLRAWTSVTGGMSGMFGLPFPPDVLGFKFSNPTNYYYLILCFLFFALLTYYFCSTGSRFGRGLATLGEDEVIAGAFGIHPTRYRLLAFAISSFIGGIAGSLGAHFIQGISPSDIAPIVSIFLVVMVMAGGSGTLVGPVIGAIILTSVPEFLRVNAQWSMVFYGVFLLAYVYFFQSGILPIFKKYIYRLFHASSDNDGDLSSSGLPKYQFDKNIEPLPLIQFESLSCGFGSLVVLNQINWKIENGKINGLIGPNGAGKTTFFNVITGNAPIIGGEMLWRDKPVAPEPSKMARLGIARTFQQPRVLDSKTVLENIRLGASLPGGAISEPYLAWLTQLFKLTKILNINCAHISHYEKRRVSIAMALAFNPLVLLLDEPFAGLDETETHELQAIIAELYDRTQLTVLLIEHKLSVIKQLCTMLSVLDNGHIIASGKPEIVARNEKVITAYLGDDE